MAQKPDWLTLTPSSGEGDAEVLNDGTKPYKGRLNRLGKVVADVVGIAEQPSYNVIQESEGEYLEFKPYDTHISWDCSAMGFTIATNSDIVNIFVLRQPTNRAAYVGTYSELIIDGAGIAGIVNGQPTPNDPGATQEYELFNNVTLDMNSSIEPAEFVIRAQYGPGFVKDITIIQDAAPAFVNTEVDTIEFDNAGGDRQLQIQSNCSWQIE